MQPGDLKPCPRLPTEKMLCAADFVQGDRAVWIAMYDAAPALPPVDVEGCPKCGSTYGFAWVSRRTGTRQQECCNCGAFIRLEWISTTDQPSASGDVEALVNQADREAAAAYLLTTVEASNRMWAKIRSVRAGDDDVDALVIAFARHRAAECARLREALEDTLAHLVAAVSILSRADGENRPPAMVVASNKMFAQMLTDYCASIDRARQALSQETTP